jgi:hypothetical protein
VPHAVDARFAVSVLAALAREPASAPAAATAAPQSIASTAASVAARLVMTATRAA